MRTHPINAALLACSLLGAACTTAPTSMSPRVVRRRRTAPPSMSIPKTAVC